MSYNERTNLLLILIAILVIMYYFLDSSENFETYKYKCGNKFKYKDKKNANGKCPPRCPAKEIDKNSAGTYTFQCIFNQKAADEYRAKKRAEAAARKKAEETAAAIKKAAIKKAETEAAIKKAEAQAAMKKAEEEYAVMKKAVMKKAAMIKAEEEMARNIPFKPIIEQEY